MTNQAGNTAIYAFVLAVVFVFLVLAALALDLAVLIDQFAAVGGHSPAVGAPSTPNEVIVPILSSTPRPAIRLDVGSNPTGPTR